jgi:Transposase DDE domain group 1
MAWCEANRAEYVFGLARSARLVAAIGSELAWAEEESLATGTPARRFADFRWTTRDSWSRRRRVVAKAEWTRGEANPRFLVTSLPARAYEARRLYEEISCARGELENRIKEAQGDLLADRLSPATMRANQLRLFGSPRWPMSCCARCAASASSTRSSRTPPAAPSASSC